MKPGVLIAIGIVLLVGLFIIFKPDGSTTQDQQKTFVVQIQNRKIVGAESFSVKQGDQVVFKITSDEDEEFHLHGYDRSVDLVKGVEKELSFTADHSGRFVFELEKSKAELGALEVQP